MTEHIRSVEIEVTVDSNKRTSSFSISTDNLQDALEQFRDQIEDLRGQA